MVAPASTTEVQPAADASASPPVEAAPATDVGGVTVAEAVPVATPEAPVTEAQAEIIEDVPKLYGSVTPRLFLFDYFKVGSNTRTQFLERYEYREGWSGDDRTGLYAGLDLSLTYGNLERDLVILDHKGFGENNYRGEGRYSDEKISVTGSYNHYRSATGGIDYLFSPTIVGSPDGTGGSSGDGFKTTFTDNSGTSDYRIDRTSYAAGLTFKPAMLAGWGSITVDYQGYQRDGNKFAPFLLDGGGGTGIDNSDRWRGINLGIDERMNRLSVNLEAHPRDLFNLSYKVSLEKFDNNASDLELLNDILLPYGVDNTLVAGSREALTPFLYIPDTTLLSQSIQVSKHFTERFLVALGYSHAILSDDSSPARFTEDFGGVTDAWSGKISTDSAHLNAQWHMSPSLNMEGFVKYHQRDNDSTFPVANVISPTSTKLLVGPYVRAIDALDYGVSGTWRTGWLNSSLSMGWQRTDRERDLFYGSIDPAQSLYREDTLTDEVYLKWSARPASGWTVRVTPSYAWSDSTGLVTEPEEAFKLKTQVSYAAPEGWLVSGFYDYRNLKNSNNTFTDGDGVLSYNQDIDNTLHSAGISLNVMPRDDLNAYLNLFWIQNDLKSYFFESSPQRWNANVVFRQWDEPNYNVNTYSVGIGADWQAKDNLKLSGSYTYSRSNGDAASGYVQAALEDATGTIDAKIDNQLHSIVLGADYVLNPKATIRANYIFDYYDDNAYSLLTGGVHSLVFGVSYAF
jgi:hypothetical protein